MNHEHWSKVLPVIQAFVDGKTIQVYEDGRWWDIPPGGKHQIDFTFPPVTAFRIKPKTFEVKYRLALMKASHAQEPYVVSVGPTIGCDDFEYRQKLTEAASDFVRWIGGPVTIQESLE